MRMTNGHKKAATITFAYVILFNLFLYNVLFQIMQRKKYLTNKQCL